MPTRLDDLLDGASPDPATPPDAEQLWVAGRRRRRWQQAGAAVGVVALLGVAGGVAANLDTFRTPQIDSVAAPEQPADDDVFDPEGADDAEPDDDDDDDEPRDQEEDEAADDDEEATDDEADADPGPSPDPAAMEAPCDAHQDRRGEAFIAVVSPVEGQVVSGELALVGCSSVYEGTVQYRLRDADGGVLIEDFTTASAGGPELGDFRDTVDVPASGELTLEVFWESPADGSEADKTTVTVQAE